MDVLFHFEFSNLLCYLINSYYIRYTLTHTVNGGGVTHAVVVEQLRNTLNSKNGEIAALQERIGAMESSRDALADEMVMLRKQNMVRDFHLMDTLSGVQSVQHTTSNTNFYHCSL